MTRFLREGAGSRRSGFEKCAAKVEAIRERDAAARAGASAPKK